MAVYLILDIEVTDADTYGDYVKQAPTTVEQYGGEPIAEDDDLFGTTSRAPATSLAASVLQPPLQRLDTRPNRRRSAPCRRAAARLPSSQCKRAKQSLTPSATADTIRP